MATYRNWLSDQEEREDDIGWYARYWSRITPGRISAPAGVERYLREHIEGMKGEGGNPEGLAHAETALGIHGKAVDEYHGRKPGHLTLMPSPGPETALDASVDRHPANGSGSTAEAIARAQGGTDPYGNRIAQGDATRLPVDHAPYAPAHPANLPGDLAASLHAQPAASAPLVSRAEQDAVLRAGKYTGWPEERFNRLEAKLDHLIGLMEQQAYPLMRAPDGSLQDQPSALLATVSDELLSSLVQGRLSDMQPGQLAVVTQWAQGLPWAVLSDMADYEAQE